MSDSCLSVCTLGSALFLCTELYICSFTPKCSGEAISLLRLFLSEFMHVFFWCWIFFISLFSPALPLQMPGRAVKVNLLSCPMQYHAVFCSLLSSLFHWTYLETVFNIGGFRASEISLPASSQHKWNYAVKKYWFFIGDCIRIWALHRIISIASNCSSSCRFALSSGTGVYFVNRIFWIPVGLTWLASSGRFSPVHWLLGGNYQDFTLFVQPALK